MKTEDWLIVGAVALGVMVLSKGKAGSVVGWSVGKTVGNTISGVVTGVTEGILINTAEWATEQKYIPIVDELSNAAAHIKNWGNPLHWFW